jgi:hypothetical protein
LNSGVRLQGVLVIALTTGCQLVAGIDDRVVAPNIDSSVADTTSAIDTSVAPDTSIEDSGTTDTTVAETAADASDTAITEDAPIDTPFDAAGLNVVVNEVRASGGGDYVEIFNAGTTTVDLSGWGITGTEDTGLFSTPIRFSAGEKLAAGAHLLVLAGMVPAPAGPQTACGGPPRCYYASWGISQSRGETLRLLYPDDTVANEVMYPMNGHADGQTWGRLPDGTSTFSVMKPTPSAANAGL